MSAVYASIGAFSPQTGVSPACPYNSWMGVDKRREPRTRAHWGVELRWDEGSANGMTENLSSQGAMMSMEDEPPLYTGEKVTLVVQLPGRGRSFELAGTVRWVSEMLPNTLGVEFDEPLPEDAIGVLDALSMRDVAS